MYVDFSKGIKKKSGFIISKYKLMFDPKATHLVYGFGGFCGLLSCCLKVISHAEGRNQELGRQYMYDI